MHIQHFPGQHIQYSAPAIGTGAGEAAAAARAAVRACAWAAGGCLAAASSRRAPCNVDHHRRSRDRRAQFR